MKKHISAVLIVGAMIAAPIVAMAQDQPIAKEHPASSASDNASAPMKGPPNANGQTDQGAEKNANAPKSGGDNGAASAKATGESGDKK